MKTHTNLHSFFKEDARICKYRYKMSVARFNQHLQSKRYKEYASSVVGVIRQRHDLICSVLMVIPLPESYWVTMHNKILSQCKYLNSNEVFTFVIWYELDDLNEITVQVDSTIK